MNDTVKPAITPPVLHRKKVYIVHNNLTKKPVHTKKPEQKKMPSAYKLVHPKLSYLKAILDGFKKEDSNFALPKDQRLHELIKNNILTHGMHVQDDFANGSLLIPGIILEGNPHDWKRETSLAKFKEDFQPKLKVVKIDIEHTQKAFRGDVWFRVKDKVHVSRLMQLVETYLEKTREDLNDHQHFLFHVPIKDSLDEAITGVREKLNAAQVTVKDGKTYLNEQDKSMMKKMGGIKFLHALHKKV